MRERTVSLIVVTYCPDQTKFENLLRAYADQVQRMIIVDNSPREDSATYKILCAAEINLDGVQLVRLGENAGVAKALNVGIEIALEMKTDFVLLSDQDSLPKYDMVENLVACHDRVARVDGFIGAVGPACFDNHSNLAVPFHELPSDFERARPEIEVAYLITSGALIPCSSIQRVGGMNAQLFIDFVDTEWCFRARSLGLKLYGAQNAILRQHFGDNKFYFWAAFWRSGNYYPPIRQYYRWRNFIALSRLNYVPRQWRRKTLWELLKFSYAHILFGQARWQSVLLSLRGIFDGAIGRMGGFGTGLK